MPFESCRTSTLTVSVPSGFLDMLFSLSIFRSQVGPVTQGLLHSPLPALRRDQTIPLNGARTRTERYELHSAGGLTETNGASQAWSRPHCWRAPSIEGRFRCDDREPVTGAFTPARPAHCGSRTAPSAGTSPRPGASRPPATVPGALSVPTASGTVRRALLRYVVVSCSTMWRRTLPFSTSHNHR